MSCVGYFKWVHSQRSKRRKPRIPLSSSLTYGVNTGGVGIYFAALKEHQDFNREIVPNLLSFDDDLRLGAFHNREPFFLFLWDCSLFAWRRVVMDDPCADQCARPANAGNRVCTVPEPGTFGVPRLRGSAGKTAPDRLKAELRTVAVIAHLLMIRARKTKGHRIKPRLSGLYRSP